MAERPPRRRRQARRHPARDRDGRTGSKDRRRRRHRGERRPRRRARCRIPRRHSPSLGYAVAAETVFAALSESWAACERLWDEGRGMAAHPRALARRRRRARSRRSPSGSAPTPCGAPSRPSTTPVSSSCVRRTARPAPSPPVMSISAPPPPRGNSHKSLMIRPQSPHPEVRAIGEPRRTHPADAAPHRRCVLRGSSLRSSHLSMRGLRTAPVDWAPNP